MIGFVEYVVVQPNGVQSGVMILRLSQKFGVTAVVAVALAAVMATPATADSSSNVYGTWPNRLAHATFTSHGDSFTVWDDEADGRAAVVFWQAGAVTGECVNSKGDNTSKTCNYDFTEGVRVKWNLVAQGWANPGCCTAVVGPTQYDTA